MTYMPISMAAIDTTTCRLSHTAHCHLHRRPTNSNLHINSFKPFFAYIPKLTYTNTIAISRSCLSHAKTTAPKRFYFKVMAISGLGIGNSEPDPDDSNKEAKIDLKLPRRSLQVQFTCNLCGGRTQRLVNRLAYERGLIYVQCSGCLQHHKLVDNLGLVVEYDLRDEINSDTKEDEV